jgi:hypothetical protein
LRPVVDEHDADALVSVGARSSAAITQQSAVTSSRASPSPRRRSEPSSRGRGVFRSLVAHRAALAAARGFRYLQVDASSDSRPILERLGFVQLATTTPFVHQGARG